MNKDALLATLIGFGIGLLITGLLLAGPNFLKLFPPIKLPTISFSQQKKNAVTPTPTPPQFAVTIESPLPDSIESNEVLLVSGATSPGATVVIGGPTDETVVVVKDDGKFAGKVTLVEGKNDVVVTSYLNDKQATSAVTAYYTEEEL